MSLEQVQIDHTAIGLIVADERDRQPTGCPHLTLAIDVFMRCVFGMMVTPGTPSVVPVGLCLAYAVYDKRSWLEGLNVEMDWSVSGKPRPLYLDNTAKFKSGVLRRGCEQHGIQLDYHPLGQPHYGSIVERTIGMAVKMVHDELSGMTFSNPSQRSGHDSEKMATLTLRGLECWLASAIGTYRGSVHNGLLQPPVVCWAGAVGRVDTPAVVTCSTALSVNFLPVIRHTLTHTDFVIDHIRYYTDTLKPWIARRERLLASLIRYDPRNINRIWIPEPKGQHYSETRYRTLSYPAVALRK